MPKYLDEVGLARFWENTKSYVDHRDPLLIAHIMMRNVNTEDWKPKLCVSRNGLDWTPVPNSFETDTTYGEMSRPFFNDGKAYFVCRTAGTNNIIGYYVTEDFVNAEFKTVDLGFPKNDVSTTWTPQVVLDASGDTYIIATCFTGETFDTCTLNPDIGELIYASSASYPISDESTCYICKVDIANGTITKSGTAQEIVVSFDGSTDYCGIDYDILYWDGVYHMLYKDTRFLTIAHATSDSIMGPYTISSYADLAVFRDVNLEAPVMTVINDRVFVNFQTYSRIHGANLLISTVDFANWDFIGYPRRTDKNQLTVRNPSTHGERPRNIAPQVVPDSMKNSVLLNTVLIETEGFSSNDFGITSQPSIAMPYYNAFYQLANDYMCPCMPNALFTYDATAGFNPHFITQDTVAMFTHFQIGSFYPYEHVTLRVTNATRLLFWQINNEIYFGGAGTQALTFDPHYRNVRVSRSTIPFSVELPSAIETNPVRAYINVPCTGSYIELKVIRRASTYSGTEIAASSNLFKLPFAIDATKQFRNITLDSVGVICFMAHTNGYIRNTVAVTTALATGYWECSTILTQWHPSESAIS